MTPEPPVRRTLIGMFPAGSEIVAFSEVERTMVADAAARLDQERAEAERRARENITVDAEFFNQVVRELDRALEAQRRSHVGRRDYDRARNVAGKIRYLRERVAETLAKGPQS